MEIKTVLASMVLVGILALGTAMGENEDIAGAYTMTAEGYAIYQDGQEFLPGYEKATGNCTIEQNGSFLKVTITDIQADTDAIGKMGPIVMVGSIYEDELVLYYAGTEDLMGATYLTEAIAFGEVEDDGKIGLMTVGGGYDENTTLIFTWTETDMLVPV